MFEKALQFALLPDSFVNALVVEVFLVSTSRQSRCVFFWRGGVFLFERAQRSLYVSSPPGIPAARVHLIPPSPGRNLHRFTQSLILGFSVFSP